MKWSIYKHEGQYKKDFNNYKRCVTCSPTDNICLLHTNNKTTCHMLCKYARECDLHFRFFRLNNW